MLPLPTEFVRNIGFSLSTNSLDNSFMAVYCNPLRCQGGCIRIHFCDWERVVVKNAALLPLCIFSCMPGNAAEGETDRYRIVAYVAARSTPAVMHLEKLTHVNFAFAQISPSGQVALADGEVEANLSRLVGLKKTNPRVKIIVSFGGWTADGFSDAALTDASRSLFADSAVQLLRRFSADGIDIDWEYPGQGVAGIKFRAEDRLNFTQLLKTLRDRLDVASTAQGRSGGDRYTLSIASADREYFEHTEMEKLQVYLDWINVMSYDFFNSLTPTTGHHAGLYRSAAAMPIDRDADASVKQHLGAGIPADKIVLGVAFYGRGFAGVKPIGNGLRQPYERFEGAHAYSELADKFIGRQGFVRYWDDRAKAPYLWNSISRTFITYDDPQSIRIKAQYVKAHHLGGMMFWELSQDRNDELLDVVERSMHAK
jgi:chitinase